MGSHKTCRALQELSIELIQLQHMFRDRRMCDIYNVVPLSRWYRNREFHRDRQDVMNAEALLLTVLFDILPVPRAWAPPLLPHPLPRVFPPLCSWVATATAGLIHTVYAARGVLVVMLLLYPAEIIVPPVNSTLGILPCPR